jgi:protein SCO1/2
VVAVALAGVVALGIWARSPEKPPAEPAPHVEEPSGRTPFEIVGEAQVRTTELLPEPAGELGSYPVVERSGRETNTSELRGKFVVANFIFTNCGGPCPAMSQQMAELQTALKPFDDVLLVSFTVDPERDTPQVLTEYAQRYGADKDRWLFLRAEMGKLREIAYDQLHLVASRDEPVLHSKQFALLDREGRVVAYYSPSQDKNWQKKLLGDVETLRRGKPQ